MHHRSVAPSSSFATAPPLLSNCSFPMGRGSGYAPSASRRGASSGGHAPRANGGPGPPEHSSCCAGMAVPRRPRGRMTGATAPAGASAWPGKTPGTTHRDRHRPHGGSLATPRATPGR
jgi:hypothetical protein